MLGFLGITAANPALLAGAAAIAAPIIIHLLARRRFRIVEWAAMTFLLDADKKNRRRIRMEHLILLLLRCLIVILIALLVARLMMAPTGLAALTMGTTQNERIFLIDDSPSMDARLDTRSSLETATRRIADFLETLSQEQRGDRVTLILTSQRDRPLVVGAPVSNEMEVNELREMLIGSGGEGGIEPSARPARMTAALAAVGRYAGTSDVAPNQSVYIVSDMRQREWPEGDGDGGDDSLIEALRSLEAEVDAMAVVDVGGEDTTNLTVTDISIHPEDKVAVTGRTTRFLVTVKNHGPADASGMRLRLMAGGTQQSIEPDRTIAPGQEEVFNMSVTFVETGYQQVSVELEYPDQLRLDNTRYTSVRVHPGVRALLIDGGDPDPRARRVARSEVGAVRFGLEPPGQQRGGYAIRAVSAHAFGRVDERTLDRADLFVIANVRELSEQRIAEIEQRVQDGAGLLVFTGANVRTGEYNRLLHRDGEGMLPVEIGSAAGDLTKERWVRMRREMSGHPAAGALDPELNRQTQFYVWNQLRIPSQAREEGDVQVLASVDDGDRSPLIVESRFGEGRVMVVATDAARDWSNWPDMPTFPIFLQEVGRYLARAPSEYRDIDVGDPLVHQIDLASFRPQVRLRPPRGDFIRRTATTDEDTARTEIRFGDADETEQRARIDQVGFYNLELTHRDGDDEDQRTRNIPFAANIEPEEGDLTRADTDALRRALAETDVRFVGEDVAGAGMLGGGRRDLRNTVLTLLLILLATELLLGWWFGRRR